MNILISNDDGYQSDGIKALYKELSSIAKATMFAPNTNYSAASSSLTITKPLKPVLVEPNIYYMQGTPSDCVHLALCGYIKEKIDLVATGINHGANLGDDVIYSGTVAGAIEGRFLGLPSIAFSVTSIDTPKNLVSAAKIAKNLVQNIKMHNFSYDTVLNVNIPDIPYNEVKGIQITRLGRRHQSQPIYQDKNDSELYWIGDNGKSAYDDIGTDFFAIQNNYVSITPLQIDLTRYSEMHLVSKWISDIKL